MNNEPIKIKKYSDVVAEDRIASRELAKVRKYSDVVAEDAYKKANEPSGLEKVAKTVGNVMTNIGKGVLKAGEGVLDLSLGVGSSIGNFVSSPFKSEEQRKKSRDKITSFIAKDLTNNLLTSVGWTPEMKKEWEEGSSIKESNLGGQVSQAAGGLMFDILSGKAMGRALGFVDKATTTAKGLTGVAKAKVVAGNVAKGIATPTTGIRAAKSLGGNLEQAYQIGATDAKAITFAITNTVGELLVESLVGGIPGTGSIGFFDDIGTKIATYGTKKVTSEGIKQLINFASNLGFKVVGEGAEESIQQVLSSVIEKATINPNKEIWNGEEILQAALVGGILGGIFEAPQAFTERATYNLELVANEMSQEQQVKEQQIKEQQTPLGQITQEIQQTQVVLDTPLAKIETQIKEVEDSLSRSDVALDEKSINILYEKLNALREQKREVILKQTEELQLAELARLEQETKEIEQLAPEEQTELAKDFVEDNKKTIETIVDNVDKDKPIKTTYNRKYILENKSQIFEKANEIVNSLNQERPSNKPIEIQPEETYTPAQKMLADVGAIFKKQVVFLNNADFGGMVPLESDDIIFINDKIDNELIVSNNETDKLTYAVGHELFHSLKKTAPDIFNEFTDFVKEDISEEQLIKFMEKYDPTDKYGLLKSMQIEGKFNLEELKNNPSKYKKQTKALNYMVEEIVANEFGGMITDKTYMTNLKNKNKGLFTKIVNALKNLFSSIDTPIYDTPLTQMQITRIRNDFETVSKFLSEELETKVEVKPIEIKVETNKQEVKKTEVKEEKLPVKKDVKKVEVKKEALPKKEVIKQEVKPVETVVEEKPKIKKEVKKPLPKKEKSLTLTKEEQARLTELASKPIIDTTAKVTKVDVESRLGYINKTLDRYNQETNATNKRELLNAATRAYDNYKKDGGKEVIQQIEDFKKEEFKSKLSDKKMLPSKEETQYTTVAPYYNTKIENNNFDVIKNKVDKEFNKKAHEFAKELNVEILNVSINKGGFTFQEGDNKGKHVEELSYTYELKDATPRQANYFASLLGDLGYEKQEAVIAYNYVDDNDSSANIVEFSVVVNDVEGLSEIVKNNGITDYTIDLSNKTIKILDFDLENQEDTNRKIKQLTSDLGGKYEETIRQKVNSRYLDSDARQNAYREWIETNKTGEQNRNLRAHFEQAQKKLKGDTKYLPTKKEQSVSKFATNTVQKSIAFSDVASEILNNPELYQYSRKTHDEARAEGLELMKTNPQETLDKIMRNDSVLTPSEKAFALLMKEYYKQKDDRASGLALVKVLKESDTRGGQSVEASKLYQDDPDFIVDDIKNMIDKMNEEFNTSKDPTIKAWLKENTNGVVLTSAEEEYLYQMANKLKGLDENSDEFATRWALINTYIANKMPKNFWTKVKNFRRMGFLFNPKTVIRNWFGNVSMVPIYKATDLIGSKIDKGLSEQLKTQRTTGTFIKDVYKEGQKEGKRASKRDYQLGILTGLGNPNEFGTGKTFNDKKIIGKSLNKIEKLTNYLMARGDRGYEQGYYLNTLTNLMRLNDVDVATDEMIEIAKNTAAKRTWKNNGAMVQTASNIRKMFNQIGIKDGEFGKQKYGSKVDIGLGDIILPFIMTPANLLVATYDFSPAAAISSIKTWKNLKETIKNGGDIMAAQKAFVDSTSKAATGTLLFIIAGALAKMGVISGGEDEDKDKRELDKILGNQPFSIKIGDKSYSYDWLQPLSNIFAIAGEVKRQKTAEKSNFMKLVGEAFTVGGDRLLEQSFLQNVRTLLGGSYNDGKSLGERVIDLGADIPASMIPTLFKQFADFLDGNIKTTYDKNSPLQTMISKTMARLPLVKSALPSKKDVLGNNMRYSTTFGESILTSFLSPMNIKKDVAGIIGDELVDVFNHTGDKTIIPQVAIKYIDYDSDKDGKTERYNFNPTQQSQLQEAMGKIVSDSFGNIFANDVYMNATYEEKASALKSLMEYAKGKALEESGLVPDYISGNANLKQIKKYIEYDLDISESIMYDSMINSITPDEDETGKNIDGSQNGKKAYTIMNMQISDKSKNIMLDLIRNKNEPAKNPETIETLSNLKTQQDFINYYSLTNRKKYNTAVSNFKIDGEEYVKFVNDLSKIESDKDSRGETIPNSKKKKVIAYINSLSLNKIQKTYLYGSAGYSIKDFKNEMYNYINKLSITTAEKNELWKSLGF